MPTDQSGDRWQQADDEGCQTHGEQCTDEGSLTANLVTEVTEDYGTEGAGNEGDAEGREGSQKLGGCVLRGGRTARGNTATAAVA